MTPLIDLSYHQGNASVHLSKMPLAPEPRSKLHLENNSSSSLYMVMTMNNSVFRAGSYMAGRSVYPSDLKSLGSHVAAVYLRN
jgi:hypothetical protein